MTINTAITISGVGRSFGETLIKNSKLEQLIGVDQGFIQKKTGIFRRFYANGIRLISSYCCEAVSDALNTSRLGFSEIDCIICATFSGDDIYPSLALKIASNFESARNILAFDLKANCTGMQSAFMVADGLFVTNPDYKNILVVGNGIQSNFIDQGSLASIYFGDACSAVILSRQDFSNLRGGFLAHSVETDTSAYNSVRLRGTNGSGVFHPLNDEGSTCYEISGLEVWKQAVRLVPSVVSGCLVKADLTPGEVQCFIWHQANLNLIEYLMAKLRVPIERAIINVDIYGNTADASIGLALYDAYNDNKVVPGDIICIAGIGAGFMAGASLLKVGEIDA